MIFEPDYRHEPAMEPVFPSLWAIFGGEDVRTGAVPSLVRADEPFPVPAGAFYLGQADGLPCWALDLDASGAEAEGGFLAGLGRISLREFFQGADEDMFRVFGRARQLVEWRRAHRYCGACGRPTAPDGREHAFACPACGRLWWPRITPAVIVAVVDGDRILLGHNRLFAEGIYSTFAGFVEPGETLEEACRREVREESGVAIDGLCYFASQPWPFPSTMMLAFTARYAGGEPVADGIELNDVRWFGRKDRLPQFPGRGGMGRRLIEWFQAGGGAE